ncbi:Copia protein like [Verticillium longisporum]|uniref:Copia protein like n=1 Tax=Verticillium longisporum TaxID=100787 RepID=A0A8I2Z6Y7_VERLO|nr:Copia protein like [Verticillium longisporum]
MLVTDRWSGMIWDYYLTDRRTEILTAAVKDLLGVLKGQYELAPKVIECDNEIMKHSLTTIAFLRTLYIKVEPSAPYTPAQNGSAEVSGSIIKTKARAMRVGARLPEHLWVEIYRAAVYLHNRTPKYIYSWRTPYDKFHTFLAHRDGVVVENRKPYQAHLRAYGCKAYAMTREAQLRTQKKQRLNPKAWIGFLVGYQSTNIYRIWNPQTGKIISTREVIFNEDELFNGDLNQLKDDLLHISRQDLIHLLDRVEQPEPDRATEAVEVPDGAFIPQRTWEGLPGEDEDLEPQPQH